MSFSQHLHPAVIALIGRECKDAQRTLAWLLWRGKMLTASEMAAALGQDKYKSRKQLMKQKLRAVKVQNTDSIACAWGNKYEAEAVAKYEQVTGRKVLNFSLIQHPLHPWLGASPDGVSIVEGDPTAEPIGLEIKCPISREITSGIPDVYYPQVQMQMQCMDFKTVHYCEYRPEGPWNAEQFVLNTIPRDNAWFEANFPAMQAFYNEWQVNKAAGVVFPEIVRSKRLQITEEETMAAVNHGAYEFLAVEQCRLDLVTHPTGNEHQFCDCPPMPEWKVPEAPEEVDSIVPEEGVCFGAAMTLL